jgi:hypothetical protein
MAAADLILQADQPQPGTGTSTPLDDGDWPVGTYSFLIVARYGPEPTADRDQLGLPSVPLLAQSIAAGQRVQLAWTPAQDSAGNIRQPRAYDILCQSGASWTYASPASLLASIDGALTTAVLDDATSLGEFVIPAEPGAVTIRPTLPLAPRLRANCASGFNGLGYRPSYAQDCLCDSVSLSVLQGSLDLPGWRQVLKWAQAGTPLRLEDADATAYVRYYYGRLLDTDYLASVWKDPRAVHNLRLLVEREETY